MKTSNPSFLGLSPLIAESSYPALLPSTKSLPKLCCQRSPLATLPGGSIDKGHLEHSQEFGDQFVTTEGLRS